MDDADEIKELEALESIDDTLVAVNQRLRLQERNVLFVSDCASDVTAFLQANGYSVTETSEWPYALRLMKEREFCAVVIDERGALPTKSAENGFFSSADENVIRIVREHSGASKSKIPSIAFQNSRGDLLNLLSMVDLAARNSVLEGKISEIRATINGFLTNSNAIFSFMMPEQLAGTVLLCFTKIFYQENGFIQVILTENGGEEQKTIFAGSGKYDVSLKDFYESAPIEVKRQIVEAKTKRSPEISASGVAMPLCGFNGVVFGVIFLELSEFDSDIFNILSIFVRQAAVLLNNSMMHKMLDSQSEQLMRSNMQLNKSYLEVVQALREAVDAKDRYTHGHSERVAMYAVEIGRRMWLSEKSLEDLRVGGIFHDIGKIAVKDEILLKKSRLTDEEYEQIKIHPAKGGDILSGISMLKDVVPIVEGHHEHYDGTGYPRGLKGNEIPLEARIMCVADAFDAMTSNREYHRKISFDDALGRINMARGKQFDPKVCDAFADLVTNDRAKIQEISEFFGNED